MRVFAWNWHTPYFSMWRRALPEVELLTLAPTTHAPGGWRRDQRPYLDGIELSLHPYDGGDIVVIQNAHDLAICERGGWSGPFVVIAHNRAEFEEPRYVSEVCRMEIPLVAISKMKAQSWRDAGYTGHIDVIPPYVNVEDYGGWTGEGGYILTVCNGLDRPLFDKAAWLEATRDLPVKLVGEGNAGIPGAVGPAQSWDDLKSLYRYAAVYFSPTKRPNEDAWNLSLLEAMATGVPCVSTQLDWQLHGVASGMPLRTLLQDSIEGHTPWVSDTQREQLASDFPLSTFRDKWLSVLERVTA